MTVQELSKPPTPVETAALLDAARQGLSEAGLRVLRRVLYQRDALETLLRKIHDYECAEGSLPVELSDALADLFEC